MILSTALVSLQRIMLSEKWADLGFIYVLIWKRQNQRGKVETTQMGGYEKLGMGEVGDFKCV
jgi:hypothetical protein